jgi:hypothetical protein
MAAPVFRGVGTVSVTANSVATPTTLTPTKPAAAVTGDQLVISTVCRSITATCATPAGWTLHPDFPKTSATASGGRIYVFVRTADGSATDSPNVVWSSLATGTSGDSASAIMFAWFGLTGTKDGTTTTTDALATTTQAIPSHTTLTAEAVEITVTIRVSDTAQTGTVAFPHIERFDSHTTTGIGHLHYVTERDTGAAGAQAGVNITPSNTTGAQTLTAAFSLVPATDTASNGKGPTFDATSQATLGTGPLSWLHTPNGTATGIVVFVTQNSGVAAITDEVTGATYGGVAMTLIASIADDAFTESGITKAFFLGSGIPTGAQTVSVTQSAASNSKSGSANSLRGGNSTRIINSVTGKAATAVQQFAVLLNAGTNGAVVLGAAHDTVSAPATDLQPGQAFTQLLEDDFGAQSTNVVRRTLEGATGTIPVNWLHTGTAAEGAAAVAVAVEFTPSFPSMHPTARMARLRR